MSEIWAYLHQLQQYLQKQEKRVQLLEEQMQELMKKVNEASSRPTIQVERIEYKFDQLKVETLEGTLNIGLNPADISELEEFQVNDHHLSPKKQMERVMLIEEALYEHIEKDIPAVIKEQAKILQLSIDDEELDMIKKDLRRQIPERVGYYLNEATENKRLGADEGTIAGTIIEQTKADILNGLIAYLKVHKEKE